MVEHFNRGYWDGIWRTYNGSALSGDERLLYDCGYDQGTMHRASLLAGVDPIAAVTVF